VSVRSKIVLLVVVFVVLAVTVVTFLNIVTIRDRLINFAISAMEQKAEKESMTIDHWFSQRFSEMNSIASNFESYLMIFEKSMIVLALKSHSDTLGKFGFEDYLLAKTNGKAFTYNEQEIEISNYEFFRAIVSEGKENSVQDNVEWQGIKSVVLASRIVGYDGSTSGVFAAVISQEKFWEMLKSVTYGKSGYSFLTNLQGTVLAHPKKEYLSKTLSQISESLRVLEDQIRKGIAGSVIYSLDGERKIAAISHLSSTKWAFVLTMPYKEIEEVFVETLWKTLIASSVVVLTSIIAGMFFGRRIIKPLRALVTEAERVARGDLTKSATNLTERNDEIGKLSKTFQLLSKSLKESVIKIKELGNRMEDFSADTSTSVKDATALSDQAQASSEQVRKSVEEIVSSIAQVSSGMEEISSGADNTARDASKLAESSERLKNKALSTQNSMKELASIMQQAVGRGEMSMEVVQKLVDLSNRIGEITNAIYKIAEQTNLLALNAAIEAARAGEAGRGFAVVADEIRKLAEESRRATEEVTEILRQIRSQITLVAQGGAEVVQQVNRSLKAVKEAVLQTESMVKDTEELASMTNDLAATSQEQSGAVEEISTALDRITKNVEGVSEITDMVSKSVLEETKQIKGLSTKIDELSSMVLELKTLSDRFKTQ